MRVFTVTCNSHPLAVVRAGDSAEAIDLAVMMIQPRTVSRPLPAHVRFDAREPSDSEMVVWLEKSGDYLLNDAPDYVLAELLRHF
jgi:hypothetical protein